jgi:tetratricopeptide (TPR) repeat protein
MMVNRKVWKFVMAIVVVTFLISGVHIYKGIDMPVYIDYVSSVEAAETGESTVADHIKAGDKLIGDPKTVEKLEKAIKEYETALKIDHDNFEALWKAALAYVLIIDIKTDALIVEKDENKPIMKDMGKKALDYAEKAYEIDPKNKEVVAVNLRAYAYYSASMGIVKAILKGAAGHYKELANELIALDDTYESGLGYSYLGRLYHMSPWPVGSSKKSMENYLKALKINDKKLDTHYWLGILYLDDKEYDKAKKEFEYVVNNPPIEFEKSWIAAFKDDAKKKLEVIKKKQK